MKVRLLVDIPVGKEHGLVCGRVMESMIILGRVALGLSRVRGANMDEFVVVSDIGESVKLLSHEFEVIDTTGDKLDES